MADSKKYTTVVTHSSQLFQELVQDRGVDVFLSLLETPASASDLTRRLGIARAKVNYLLDCLLQEDLIYLHSQARQGSHVETCYAAKVDSFYRRVGYESGESRQVKTLLHVLDVMKENIMQSIRTKEPTHLGVVHVNVSKGRVQEYIRRLRELQEEFEQEDVGMEADNRLYTLAVSICPNPERK